MSPLDTLTLERKFALIEEDLSRLQELSHTDLETFMNDYVLIAVAERLLQRVAGRLIDSNFHILKENHQEIPKDYYHSFMSVAKHGYVSKENAAAVAPLAGLRNWLSLQYGEIDSSVVYKAISPALKSVPQYVLELQKSIQ